MSRAYILVLVGVASLILEIKLAFNISKISLLGHGHGKIQSIGIGSKNLCK